MPPAVPRQILKYDEIRDEAEKPLSQRRQFQGKDGEFRDIRKYSKNDDQLSAYWTKRKTLGSYVNPLEREGPCKGQIESLVQLGVDQWHSFAAIKQSLQPIMEKMSSTVHRNQWVAFATKPTRNAARGKDLDGRIIQNFEVLQRLTGKDPYGYKLLQALSCVDIKFVPVGQDPETFSNGQVKGIKGTYHFRLRTKFEDQSEVQPYNNYKGKRRGRPRKEPPANACEKS
jgi:hypothetical protein